MAPMVVPLLMVCLCLEFHGRGATTSVALLASLLAAIAFMGVVESRWALDYLPIAAIALVVGLLASWLCILRLGDDPAIPQSVTGTFWVLELRGQEGRRQVRLKGADGRQWVASVDPSLEELGLKEGLVLSLRASTQPLVHSSGFSEMRYWRARGVVGRLNGLSVQKALAGGISINRLRQFLRERLELLPSGLRGLVGAVLLGDRDPDTVEAYRRWGTSHLLAVSGWHVGLCLGLCSFLCGGGPRGLLFSSLFLWGYVIVSGQALSAIRSASMLQIALAGLWIGRRGSGLNSVALAAVVMVCLNPFVYWDLGWQMSVLSAFTLCCTMGPGPFQRLRGLAVSPLLWLLTAPMGAPLSGGIFFSALPVNAMALPVFGVLLPLCLLASLPTVIGCPGGEFFAMSGELALLLWERWADLWTQWLPLALPAGFFSPGLCGAVLFLLLGLRLRLAAWRVVVLALSAGAFGYFLL